MRRIKAYKDFQLISESLGFGNSEEYRVLKEKYTKISKEYFQEHFYDITDENIVDFNYWNYIGTDKGYINDLIDTTKEHYIYYSISMKPKDKSIDTSSVTSIDGLKKVSDNINRIVNSIESFEGRIVHDGLIITSMTIPTTGVTPSMRAITITIKGPKIDKSDLEKYYGKWRSMKGPGYDEGIKRIREEYRKNGIPNVELDTNEDMDEDIVHIGFMMLEDEIISVATYSKKHDDFDIDWPEFRRSINEYINR